MSKKRLILLVALIVLVAAFAKKGKAHRESEWHGLSESEVRAKLDAKLPGKVPAEKRSAISDKVVAKMRDRGVIVDETAAPDAASDLADDEAQLADH